MAARKTQPKKAAKDKAPAKPRKRYMAPEEKEVSPSRSDWRHNQERIRLAIATCIKQNKRMPTQVELAKATGLHEDTVWRHLKNFKMEDFFAEYRALTPAIMDAFANRCLRDADASSVKLWLQTVHGWNEKLNFNLQIDDPIADVEVEEFEEFDA